MGVVNRPIHGAAGFLPTDVAGLAQWLRADLGITKDGSDRVATWADQSGNSKDHTAATTKRPTWVDSVVNGHPIIRFDAVANNMNGANLSSLTAGEVFIVLKLDVDPPASQFDAGLWDYGTADANSLPTITDEPTLGDAILDSFGSTTRQTTVNPSVSMTSWRTYSVITTSAEWTNKLDSTQLFTTATNTVGFMTDCYLGGTNNSTWLFDGDFAEFILFDHKLSTADRLSITDYIFARYGI